MPVISGEFVPTFPPQKKQNFNYLQGLARRYNPAGPPTAEKPLNSWISPGTLWQTNPGISSGLPLWPVSSDLNVRALVVKWGVSMCRPVDKTLSWLILARI